MRGPRFSLVALLAGGGGAGDVREDEVCVGVRSGVPSTISIRDTSLSSGSTGTITMS